MFRVASVLKMKPAPAFNTKGPTKRSPIGNQFRLSIPHGMKEKWYKEHYWCKKPWGVRMHRRKIPRVLLDRDIFKGKMMMTKNIQERSRWEVVVNGMRHKEDKWTLVEEEGKMHKINWKLYSQRLETELQAAKDNLPQFGFLMLATPIAWKKLDVQAALIKGLSVREAIAQCKLSSRKAHQIILRALENAQQGAEGKGLEKENLRVASINVWKGPVDKQIDIRSRGYHAWKTKRSTHLLVVVTEDPEMVLPDRSAVPYSSLLSLRKAGLRSEPTVLDVPAITAEGI